MNIRLILKMISLGLLIQSDAGWAQDSDDDAGTNSEIHTGSITLLSHEEIWDFFEALCQERPTRRCDDDLITRLRNGDVIPAPTYDEFPDYRSRNEMLEDATRDRDFKDDGKG